MSLFRPYQVVSEIWRGSDPDISIGDSGAWKSSIVSPLVGLWWAAYLICNTVGQVAGRVAFRGDELTEMKSASYLLMVSDGIDVVGFVVTAMLVWQMTKRQEQKHLLVGNLPLSKKSPPIGLFGCWCPKCGKGVEGDTQFCQHCGEPL